VKQNSVGPFGFQYSRLYTMKNQCTHIKHYGTYSFRHIFMLDVNFLRFRLTQANILTEVLKGFSTRHVSLLDTRNKSIILSLHSLSLHGVVTQLH
jgi:hypothetical protein